jgi:hypothetical protein
LSEATRIDGESSYEVQFGDHIPFSFPGFVVLESSLSAPSSHSYENQAPWMFFPAVSYKYVVGTTARFFFQQDYKHRHWRYHGSAPILSIATTKARPAIF